MAFVIAGGLFLLVSWFFYRQVFVFVSPDSMYMVVEGQSFLETGFSQWYFASPLLWGIFVPIIQTIGMLFGSDYSWFVQPVISLTFLLLFVMMVYRASRQLSSRKVLPIILALLGAGVMVSANMYWVAQFYIHTNLDSGISLFLVVISLYFSVKDKQDSWLGIAAIFLIMFGMTRTENVIIASLIIILVVSSRKIGHRKLMWAFLPYLIFQIVWNLIVLQINPVAFGNLMDTDQLAAVTVGLVVLIGFLFLTKIPWIQRNILPRIPLLIVTGIALLFVVVFVQHPTQTFRNIWNNFSTMFVTGKWLTTFWSVVLLLLLFKPMKKIVFNSLYEIVIFGFFSMIVILGGIKGNYHTFWYDSANRMYIHILPVMVFYLTLKISSRYSLSEGVPVDDDMAHPGPSQSDYPNSKAHQ